MIFDPEDYVAPAFWFGCEHTDKYTCDGVTSLILLLRKLGVRV